MLNKRYIKSIKRDIFVLISFPVFLFQFRFCYILERKDKKWFKRDIIVSISFLILFVSISFLVNIGKEMSLPGFRRNPTHSPELKKISNPRYHSLVISNHKLS